MSLIRITSIVHSTARSDIESVLMSRTEMQRRRLRRTTDRGTDIGIELPAGTRLHDGDLLQGEGMTVMVRQAPETVGIIRPAGRPVPPQVWMLVSHAIGNMHRPISVQDDQIIFPIHDTTESDTFARMLEGMVPGRFCMSIQRMVFVPHQMADVSGHV